MTMDMSRYLGLFVTEASEHLEALGRDLVQLERDGDAGAVDSMFRHAHSVKGMASSMGFEPVAILAHRVEDLVDAVRQDKSRLDRELVDLLLAATDTMLAQVRAVAESRPPEEAGGLLVQLAARVSALTGHAPAPTRVARAVVLKPVSPEAGAKAPAEASPASAASAASASPGAAGAQPAAGAQSATGAPSADAAQSAAGVSPAGGAESGASASPGLAGAQSTASASSAAGAQRAAGGQAIVSAPSTVGASPSGSTQPAASTSSAVGAPSAAGAPRVTGGTPSSAAAELTGSPAASDAARAAEPAEPAAPGTPESTPPAASEARAEGALGAPPRFLVRMRIAPTCQVPGVRAFLVHKRLTNLGTLVDLRPALEDLKAGRIPDGLIQAELETSSGEAGIQAALRNVSEVEVLSIKPAVAAPPPPGPAPAAEAVARGPVGEGSARTVRVRTELLDYFLDTVGELLLATARLREVGKELPAPARPALEEGVYRLHTLVKDLHDKVMSARMMPLSVITDRLPRAARDIARKREREVDLVITGAEIELDRAILDELADPLMHLLRNCIDHGLEPAEERAAAKKGPRGRVLVAVRRARDRVIVEIEDDGRGMDAARLRAKAVERGLITPEAAARMTDREAFMLSCLPGVSTARDVSEISGRGVGMDAVKRVVENVGGTLEIESELGRGTRFTLRLPLTVAVVHLLLVQVGEEVFGLPIAKVLGATEADAASLSRSRETALLPHGSGLLPVYALDELVGIPAPPREGVRPFVVTEGEAGRVALAVDRLLGQEEAVLKPLSRPLDLLPGLSGVTILGSGRPVFILDVPRLLSA
ncbi:chemotaxis protein CheW [Myxococcaceae bacterium GXIMD 01537]